MISDEKLHEYIISVRWQTAKDGSHQYTMVDWAPKLEKKFRALVAKIYEKGYKQSFYGTDYTYLDFNGFTYWSMNYPVEITTLVNRKETVEEPDYL